MAWAALWDRRLFVRLHGVLLDLSFLDRGRGRWRGRLVLICGLWLSRRVLGLWTGRRLSSRH